MANQEHLAILEQGVQTWNRWREKHTEVEPDLREANLYDAVLYEANLSGAYFYSANLSEADLSGANLYAADLSEANLSRAYLSEALLRTTVALVT